MDTGMSEAPSAKQNDESGGASRNVIAVTVTYGNREVLLRQVLDSLPAQGVARVVVVDNGAQWPVADSLRAAFGDFVDVVTMGRNTGSAGGFKAGIERAMALQPEFIWLLDDDNLPEAHALTQLCDALVRRRSQPEGALQVACAFRPVGYEGIQPTRLTPRHSSYCGFHVLDIPQKLIKRTPLRYLRRNLHLPEVIALPLAPYSGLLFAAALPLQVGLPREDFVLYCDDYEWTSRIVGAGGSLLLVTSAKVTDLERTWGGSQSNHPLSLLRGRGDVTAYYAMRNAVYFYQRIWCRHPWSFRLNRMTFNILLWWMALLTRRWTRYELLRLAARDGRRGVFGANPEYQL